ncbi:cupin domain-containing protein [Candidimonas nitroreducens]|uniref:Gentisate 1,2-dioxygenase n=1 Tax=Candidimonas nitroreducens TaxID=683354 RepID=A0A225M907_9BURK|nr:cupin domain-containing protein [Candidimonas nitroreducens]OWT56733.1 gentisate 1,2-dioxygenase [Candidimonas nitroreducens]
MAEAARTQTTQDICDLDSLYPVLNRESYTAGWHKARPSLWKEPVSSYKPRHWRYEEARRYIDLAARWIGTDKAERRNLLMFNPVGDNDYASLPNLVAAYQMLRPGEHARAHRHTPNALRLVLEAHEEVYTVVDGVQLPMVPGDVLLTPGWAWHSHFDNGRHDAYWIDFLDVPLVHRLESMFFEPHPDQYQAVEARPTVSPMRFSAADQDRLLQDSPDNARVRSVRLDTPSMRTIALSVIQISAAAQTPRRREACSRLFAVITGRGTFQVGEQAYACEAGDVVAVPIWTAYQYSADSETRLLEVSDEPVQQMLGLFRAENAG